MRILAPVLVTTLMLFGCQSSDSEAQADGDPDRSEETAEHQHGTHEEQHGDSHQETDSNRSNQHMHQRPFEELVASFEADDRDSWQQPDSVLALLAPFEAKTIADIGAGTGYFSFKMSELGADVIAIDVDQRFLDYIDERAEGSTVSTRKVPYDDPMLAPAEVDAVIIVNTYHHIEERSDYFRKVLKGLKPGGVLLVVDYKLEETPHGPPMDHRLAPLDVISELAPAGFSSFELNTDLLDYQYVISASAPQEENL